MRKIKPNEPSTVISKLIFKLHTGRINSEHCLFELRNCIEHNNSFSDKEPAIRKFLENELLEQSPEESEYAVAYFDYFINPFLLAISFIESFTERDLSNLSEKISRLEKTPLMPLHWTKSYEELKLFCNLLVTEGVLKPIPFNKLVSHWTLRVENIPIRMAISHGELEPLSTMMNGNDIVHLSIQLNRCGLVEDDDLSIARHFFTRIGKLTANAPKVRDHLNSQSPMKTRLSIQINNVLSGLSNFQSQYKTEKVQKTGILSEYDQIKETGTLNYKGDRHEQIINSPSGCRTSGIGETNCLPIGMRQENSLCKTGTGTAIQTRRLIGVGKKKV